MLDMAIGHTRRLCAPFINKATEALGIHLHRKDISHATRLDLASVETWIHEENSQASSNLDPDGILVKVRGVQHSDGEGVEPKDENINVQQQPSGSAAEPATSDSEASGNEFRTEETDPSKLEWELAGDDKDKKPNKKGSSGAIPKATKKPPNSNQSTPKTA